MGDGAFMCSLYLSANILPDSLMYSASQATLSHLYLYITPLFCQMVFVLGFSKKVLDGAASLEMHLYAMFAADILQFSLKPLMMYDITM